MNKKCVKIFGIDEVRKHHNDCENCHWSKCKKCNRDIPSDMTYKTKEGKVCEVCLT